VSIYMFAGVSALSMSFRKSEHPKYHCKYLALACCRCLQPQHAAQTQFAEGDVKPAAS
jgi:hypothetical protein